MMKYAISAVVSSVNLAEALNGLHRFSATVNVTHVESASIDIVDTVVTKPNGSTRPNTTVAKAPHKRVKVKRHTRSKRDVRDGSLNAQIKALIESYGTPPFALKDLITKAHAQGLNTPTVFRGLNIEMKAGRLHKIRAGQYQRKGASFAQQLGFGG